MLHRRMIRAVRKGDYPGHPFRGNQWTRVAGATDVAQAFRAARAEASATGHRLQLLMDRIRENGGFTVQPVSGRDVVHGIAVSIGPQHSFSCPADKLTPQVIRRWMHRERVVLGRPGVKIGGWLDTETGTVWLDPVEVYPQRLKRLALSIAAARNQIAVFDLDHGREIRVGGTGLAKASGGAIVHWVFEAGDDPELIHDTLTGHLAKGGMKPGAGGHQQPYDDHGRYGSTRGTFLGLAGHYWVQSHDASRHLTTIAARLVESGGWDGGEEDDEGRLIGTTISNSISVAPVTETHVEMTRALLDAIDASKPSKAPLFSGHTGSHGKDMRPGDELVIPLMATTPMKQVAAKYGFDPDRTENPPWFMRHLSNPKREKLWAQERAEFESFPPEKRRWLAGKEGRPHTPREPHTIYEVVGAPSIPLRANTNQKERLISGRFRVESVRREAMTPRERNSFSESALVWDDTKATWVPPEQIVVTLRYLGPAPRVANPAIAVSKMSKPGGGKKLQPYDPATGRYSGGGVTAQEDPWAGQREEDYVPGVETRRTRNGTEYDVGLDGLCTVHVSGSPSQRFKAVLDVFREEKAESRRHLVEAEEVLSIHEGDKVRTLSEPPGSMAELFGTRTPHEDPIGEAYRAKDFRPVEGQVLRLTAHTPDGYGGWERGESAEVWLGTGQYPPEVYFGPRALPPGFEVRKRLLRLLKGSKPAGPGGARRQGYSDASGRYGHDLAAQRAAAGLPAGPTVTPEEAAQFHVGSGDCPVIVPEDVDIPKCAAYIIDRIERFVSSGDEHSHYNALASVDQNEVDTWAQAIDSNPSDIMRATNVVTSAMSAVSITVLQNLVVDSANNVTGVREGEWRFEPRAFTHLGLIMGTTDMGELSSRLREATREAIEAHPNTNLSGLSAVNFMTDKPDLLTHVLGKTLNSERIVGESGRTSVLSINLLGKQYIVTRAPAHVEAALTTNTDVPGVLPVRQALYEAQRRCVSMATGRPEVEVRSGDANLVAQSVQIHNGLNGIVAFPAPANREALMSQAARINKLQDAWAPGPHGEPSKRAMDTALSVMDSLQRNEGLRTYSTVSSMDSSSVMYRHRCQTMGRTDVVTEPELQRLIREGKAHSEWFRGLFEDSTSPRETYAWQWVHGRMFPGTGTHGNGTYAAAKSSTHPTAYGDHMNTAASYATSSGSLLRGALKSTALVIHEPQARTLATRLRSEVLDQLSRRPGGDRLISYVPRDHGELLSLTGITAMESIGASDGRILVIWDRTQTITSNRVRIGGETVDFPLRVRGD